MQSTESDPGNGTTKAVEQKPLSSLPEGPEDYQEITEAMLQQSLAEANSVPSPRVNGHRPLKAVCSSDPLAPPVPPRTYSQRPHMSNGSTHTPQAPSSGKPFSNKPNKPYNLSNFKFVKLLGKGSFGKVSERLSNTFAGDWGAGFGNRTLWGCRGGSRRGSFATNHAHFD